MVGGTVTGLIVPTPTGPRMTVAQSPSGGLIGSVVGSGVGSEYGSPCIGHNVELVGGNRCPDGRFGPRIAELDFMQVQLIDVDTDSDWRNAAKITGTFPAYEHPAITRGYSVTSLTCRSA